MILPRKSKIVFKRLVALKEAENHTFVVEAEAAMKKMLGLKKCKLFVLKFLRKKTYLWYEFEYLWYEFVFLLRIQLPALLRALWAGGSQASIPTVFLHARVFRILVFSTQGILEYEVFGQSSICMYLCIYI